MDSPRRLHYSLEPRDGQWKKFREMFEKQIGVDVTLVCENRRMKCHRLVLVVHSPFFQSLFKGSSGQVPDQVVYLPGMKMSAVEKLVRFMYSGVLSFHSNEFKALRKAAKELKITELQSFVNGKPSRDPDKAKTVGKSPQNKKVPDSSKLSKKPKRKIEDTTTGRTGDTEGTGDPDDKRPEIGEFMLALGLEPVNGNPKKKTQKGTGGQRKKLDALTKNTGGLQDLLKIKDPKENDFAALAAGLTPTSDRQQRFAAAVQIYHKGSSISAAARLCFLARMTLSRYLHRHGISS